VKRITVVQDTVEEIAKVICEAISRKPQFIVTTGGLGPTFDDKTLAGVARAFNQKLEVNQNAFGMVKEKCEEYARKRGLSSIEMTAPRLKMATIPEKSEPIKNPIGTAPGVRLDVDGTSLFVLPGVPSEMEAIFMETIAPLLKQIVGDSVFCEKSIFVDNMAEGNLAPFIDKIMEANSGVYIKSHVCTQANPTHVSNKPHLETHFTMTAKTEDHPSEKLVKAVEELAALVKQNGGVVIEEQ
jgi:molybdopterin-biosynthesis enzyme MoeA-like protein